MLFLALLWLNNETGARSTLLALAGFAALAVINIVLKKDIRISSKISFLLVLSPLIIAALYMTFIESGILEKWFAFMVKRGKTLDAREKMWMYAMSYYIRNPIIGSYNAISGGTGMSQLHNTHVDVLVSYGTLPFILFIAVLHHGVSQVLPKANTNFARMCMFAFYAVLLQGSFEAALVSGGTGLYILSFGFLLLAKFNPSEDFVAPTIKVERRTLYYAEDGFI